MRRFVFKLETLLDLKKRLEEEKIREFSAVTLELDNQKNNLEILLNEVSEKQKELARKLEQDIDLKQVKMTDRYIEHLKWLTLLQRDTISQLEVKVEQKRLELVEAARERRTVEKLKEKQFARYQKALSMEEQKLLDEVGSIKAAYRRQEIGGTSLIVLIVVLGLILAFAAAVWFKLIDKSFLQKGIGNIITQKFDSQTSKVAQSQTEQPVEKPSSTQTQPPRLEDALDQVVENLNKDNPDLQAVVEAIKKQITQISAKEEELLNWEKHLDSEKQDFKDTKEELEALRTYVTKEITRLEEIRNQQEAKEQVDWQSRMDRLAKLYEGLKPKVAIEHLHNMPNDMKVEILLRMNQRMSSKLLNEYSKKYTNEAGELVNQMSNKQKL